MGKIPYHKVSVAGGTDALCGARVRNWHSGTAIACNVTCPKCLALGQYNALADLVKEATHGFVGQPSKIIMLNNLEAVLRADARLSQTLQKLMAKRLREIAS